MPWNTFDDRENSRMPHQISARRQIYLLKAQVAAAERAAGMSKERIRECERAMEHYISERLRDADKGIETDAALLSLRLAALHVRLRFAKDYRVTGKDNGA